MGIVQRNKIKGGMMKVVRNLFITLVFTLPILAMEQPEKFQSKEEYEPQVVDPALIEKYSYLANLATELQEKIIIKAIKSAKNFKDLMNTIHAIALVNKQLNAIIMSASIQKLIIKRLTDFLVRKIEWTGKETEEERFIKILESAIKRDLYFYVDYQAKNKPEVIKKHPSLLYDAAFSNAVKSGEILLNIKIPVNTTEPTTGDTPLHVAARTNLDDSFAKLLINHKANINAKNSSGSTPLHIAANRGNTAIVKLLIDHKANVNEQNNAGQTPLDRAIKNDYSEIIQLLLKAGAHPSI